MFQFWNKFWFKTIDARQYAVLRIAFGFLSAVYLFELWPYLPSQFSNNGWLNNSRQVEGQNGGSWSLYFLDSGKHSVAIAYSIMGIGLISALFLTIGWHSRYAAFITWLVWISLWNRNPLILDGDDAVLKIMCFYLMLAPCGRAWSMDAYKTIKGLHVTVWPLRLVQFQIALIYFVSGWVKFHSPEWNNGSVLRYVLIHPHYSRWDNWLILDNQMIQGLLAALAQIIRWWELLFPLLLFSRFTRTLSLAFGVAFHLSLFLIMNLRWFPWIMLSLYPALLPTRSFSYYADNFERFIAKRISVR